MTAILIIGVIITTRAAWACDKYEPIYTQLSRCGVAKPGCPVESLVYDSAEKEFVRLPEAGGEKKFRVEAK